MLLLDNFVHSDLHPGNIMIKFVKPASAMLLFKNALKAVFQSKVKPLYAAIGTVFANNKHEHND